jgi:hypothetical protein
MEGEVETSGDLRFEWFMDVVEGKLRSFEFSFGQR